MGTNFYLQTISNACKCCGRGDESEKLHIGKSSGGWCFSLHVDPFEGINDLSDWIERMHTKGTVITNEYGETLSPPELLKIITGENVSNGYPYWCFMWRTEK